MVWVGPPEALENEGLEKAEAVSAALCLRIPCLQLVFWELEDM